MGRLIFGERAMLNSIPTCPPHLEGMQYETVISDDLYYSATFAKTYNTRFRMSYFGELIELPAPHPSSINPEHSDRRAQACRSLFADIAIGEERDDY